MSEYETAAADSPYHRTLPIGERLSGRPLVDDWLSCFDEVTLKVLEPMLVPEKPRAGELDRAECGHCRPSEHTIWTDDLWQVRAGWDRIGLPYVGGIAPREHHRLEDAPLELLTTLGPLLQRVSAAVKSIPGVARCHFARWGDGSEHFHMWARAPAHRGGVTGHRRGSGVPGPLGDVDEQSGEVHLDDAARRGRERCAR